MTGFLSASGRGRAVLAALALAALVFANEQLIEHFAQQRARAYEKNQVLDRLSTLRASLEGVVNANFYLIHGLTAVIAAHPDIDQARFSAIARNLVNERHALRNIGGAPNMVISLMHPLQGNEAALGLNYLKHPTQREAAVRARDSGRPVVAGPLPLQQGGIGLIVREPVFLETGGSGEPAPFWGLVSAVIDVDKLFRQVGLAHVAQELELALRGTNGTGAAGPVFYGNADTYGKAPVMLDVIIPGGTWQLAALPKGGWGQEEGGIGLIRLFGLLAGLVGGALVYRLLRSKQALVESSARLLESQGLFQRFMDNLPVGVFIRDPAEQRMLFENPWLREHLQPGEVEKLARKAGQFLPQHEAREAITQETGSHRFQQTCEGSDGHSVYCDIQTFEVPRSVGAPLLGGVIRDITARTRAEAALFESEARLRLFIDHAPAALAMFDRQMRYLAVSQRWIKDYGLEGRDLLGKSHYDIFPNVPHAWREAHQRGLAGEVVRAEEDRFAGADGSLRWLRWEVRPWRRADGGVGGIVIFTEDITDRHQAQEALRLSEQRLNEAQRLAKLGNWELDLQTNVLSWSDEIFRIFEIDKAQFGATYEAFIETVHPEDRERVNEAYRRSVDSRLPYDITHRLLFADGRVKYVHEIGQTFYADDGTPLRSVGTVQDVTERKLAEAQARQSEILLDSVFQALPDLFFLMDADGTIRDFRVQRGGDLYVPPQAFLNKRVQEVLPPDLAGLFQRKLAEVAARPGLVTYEYDLPMGGETRRFEARLTRLPDSTQVIAVVRDITREHHDRAELAASEVRYRQLFEHNPAPMLVYEKSSLRLLAVNEAFVRHYGYAREEALALCLPDLYPPEEREPLVARVASLSGLAFAGEWHHRRKDGGLITVEARSHDLVYEGHPARIVVVADISERKRAEEALKESEERLRLALQSANQGMYDLDLRTGEAAVSPEYARMLGYDPASFRETNAAWLARLHPDDHERVRRVFEDYLAGKIPDYRVEFRQRTQDGQWKWILSVGRIQAWDENGRPSRMLGTHTDITAVREAEEEIRRLNVDLEQRVLERTAQLAAVNKELETFSYSVSHDLKAPLRGIDGYSRLLLEDYEDRLDEEGRLFLRNIRRGVEQMGQLIEDLLAYSRMERRSLHSHSLDLSLQIANALNERLAEIQARGVVVKVAVHGLMARADPEGLAMVLRNLIDNALKFTRDSRPPRLRIEAQAQDKSIIIALADNGIGFDMQFHERIFEIFQRLQRAEDYPGTGVGLAIVRKTMQRMGGRVWAESARGEGATFYLELPK